MDIFDCYVSRVNKIKTAFGKGNAFVAMFHNIVQNREDVKDAFSCTREEFINFVNITIESGYCFVSIDELLALTKEQLNNKCLITFDDIYSGAFLYAIPYLVQQHIPFVVYVSTSLLDTYPFISKEQLDLLSEEKLCTVGVHGHKHIRFKGEGNAVLKNDYLHARELLSKYIKDRPVDFAFPYGSRDAVSWSNCEVVRNLGVRSIMLTTQRPITFKDIKEPFSIPRIDIPGYYNGTCRKVFRIIDVGKQ